MNSSRATAKTEPYATKSCSDTTTLITTTKTMMVDKPNAIIITAATTGQQEDEPKHSKKTTATTATSSTHVDVGRHRKRKYKPDGFPKRPLSAYNIFFKETRQKLLAGVSGGDGGVQKSREDINGDGQSLTKSSMVKRIATMWKMVDKETMERVNQLAKESLARYKDEVEAYEEAEKLEKQKLEQLQKARQDQDAKMEDEAKRGLIAAEEEKGRSFGLPMFNSLASRSIDGTSIRANGGDELQMLLKNETHALEMVENLKVRQLSLARRLQASNPQLQVLATLEKERAALGLSPLTYSTSDTIATSRREVPGKRLSSILPPRPIMGFNQSSFHDRDTVVARQQEDATLLEHPLDNNKRLRKELMNKLRQQAQPSATPPGASALLHHEATFSELAAKRRNLLDQERSLASMMDRLEDRHPHHYASSSTSSYLHGGGGRLRSTSANGGSRTTNTAASSRQLELDTLRLQEEEMTIRIKRLRKKQEVAHHLIPSPHWGGYSLHHGPEPSLSELMAQHQKLLAEGGSVSRIT